MNNRSLKFKNIEASSQGSNWKFGQLKNNSHAVNKPFDAFFNPGNPYVQMISFWLFNLRNKMLKIIIFSNDKWYSNIFFCFFLSYGMSNRESENIDLVTAYIGRVLAHTIFLEHDQRLEGVSHQRV